MALALLIAPLPLLSVATPARADTGNLVVNGSFETPSLALGTYAIYPDDGTVPGWTETTGCGIEVEHDAPHLAAVPPDGVQNAELDSNCSATLTQTVQVTPGLAYGLQVAFAGRPGTSDNRLQVSVAGTTAAGGTSTTQASADGTTPEGQQWRDVDLPVRAAGTSLTISLSDLSTSDSEGTLVDDVRLTPLYDPSAVQSNTSWPGAALLATDPVATGTLGSPGEARWYRFPVTPGSTVRLDLSGLTSDASLTLFGDIGAAFSALQSTSDLARVDTEQSQATPNPSAAASPSIYSPSIYSPSIYSPSIYSPSIYSPSIYSPSIYSPSIYSPSIYSPSIYSPSIYSPSIYSPSIYSPSDAFLQAFSSAQTRSLLTGSDLPGTAGESVTASTWAATGSFYARVQLGQGQATTPFSLALSVTGGPCAGLPLDDQRSTPLGPLPVPATPPSTVVLTDTARLGLSGTAKSSYLSTLAALPGSVVVDANDVQRTRLLNQQADASTSCTWAKNLVAQSLRDVVNSYRSGSLRYVVIAGGDAVVPFFRYADTAGLAPESDYVPPVRDDSGSQASLRTSTVLGQDAYGTQTDLSLRGSVLPVPDLAVGRLVETPDDITGAVRRFLSSSTLPTPRSSLVTGYDFLTRAADSAQADLVAGLGSGARTDTLVTDQGVAPTSTTVNGRPDRSHSWTATDLRNALAGTHHDVLFLAGHFSSANTEAADYSTTVTAAELAAQTGLFTGTLVLSPGCHSGYSLPDGDGITGVTPTLDWPQTVLHGGGTLIAGSGYQYADTDFLAYSARLLADVVTQLRGGTAGTPVGLGAAVVAAKRAYLARTATLSGIDEKSLLEATLYGLPMTGLTMPGTRTVPPSTPVPPATTPVTAGPGASLGLQTAPTTAALTTTPQSRAVLDLSGRPTGTSFRWLTGPDGVQTAPAVPALPLQVQDATVPGQVLRGVGFRSGTYVDTTGTTPLTGAPTTEVDGLHTSFGSPSFWPHRLVTVNSTGLLTGAGDGRTRLVLTGAQYRAEPGAATATERRYSSVGLTSYYSSATSSPALAAPPSISDVSVSPDGDGLTFRARVTGDPTAGIQQVWVTYTAESGPWHGSWQSLDLTQDPTDSLTWTGHLPLPSGQLARDVRVLVQAVNGVGGVAYDDDSGDGYRPPTSTAPATSTTLALTSAPSSAASGSTVPVGVKLTGAAAGSPVQVQIGSASGTAVTGTDGTATVQVPLRVPAGSVTVTASYAGDDAHLPSATPPQTLTVKKAPTSLAPNTYVAQVPATGDATRWFTLTSGSAPLVAKAVLLDFFDKHGNRVLRTVRATDGRGRVDLGRLTLPKGDIGVLATFGTSCPGSTPDPVYAPAASGMVLQVK